MDNGKECGRSKDRHVRTTEAQQNYEDQTAKQCFFNRGHDERCAEDLEQAADANGCAQRIDVKPNNGDTAAEQGNSSKEPSKKKIARPARVRVKIEIAQAADANRAKQRPQQRDGSDEKGAMKETFEIYFSERGKNSASDEPLRRPKKNGRKQHADNQDDE